ncbi:hypothetical protein [Streptomyces sp. C10-9-1]|uniref:hypothetical protein n=1 Tax=Streptomyces sp. C10-9-1 TaxID=1859285 RepID=UPI003F49BA45
MTATAHLARRSSHHPVRALLTTLLLPRSRRVQARYFERLRTTLPLTDPDRHDLESPAAEAAFARLAVDHPDKVTPASGDQAAADRTQYLLAVCDVWFREAHGPEHTWSPQTLAAYTRLLRAVQQVDGPAARPVHGGEA